MRKIGNFSEFLRGKIGNFSATSILNLYRAREEANATYICRNPLKDCQIQQAHATDGSNPL